MFSIVYGLFSLSMNAIDSIYNSIQNSKSKRNTYDPKTGTYIDNFGCTRDYKTGQYRNITNQWNYEKKRYEHIILGNNGKIIRNLTEEDEQRKIDLDWKIKVDNKIMHKLPNRSDISLLPMEVYNDFYKPKDSDDIIMLIDFYIHRKNQDIQKIKVWFMPYKFKVYKIETNNVDDITINMLNDSIEQDERGINGSDAKFENERYYIHGAHLWLD